MRRFKKLSKQLAAFFMVSMMLFVPATSAHASTGWNQNSTGWWWEETDGSYPVNAWKQINGTWYYFDGDGYMATGWRCLGGTWYYMDSSGAMVTGWQKIGGTWYYFYGSGAMASNTTVDGYYLDASGAWVENTDSQTASGQWVQSGSRWWYRNADGTFPAGGWKEIGGTWYLFDKNGWMLTGWHTIGGNWYYMDKSGAMLTGWQNINNVWYYLAPDGHWDMNAGNDPTASRPSGGGGGGTDTSTEEVHEHNWVEVYTTVEHPAETHMENVCVDPGATWPKYEYHMLCDHCGFDYELNKDTSPGSHTCPDGKFGGTYSTKPVVVGTITFPPRYEEQEVVDKEAWTEQVLTGYTCECGATKGVE